MSDCLELCFLFADPRARAPALRVAGWARTPQYVALIQTNSLSVKKEGTEQLAPRRKEKERGKKDVNEGNCEFDTLNGDRH